MRFCTVEKAFVESGRARILVCSSSPCRIFFGSMFLCKSKDHPCGLKSIYPGGADQWGRGCPSSLFYVWIRPPPLRLSNTRSRTIFYADVALNHLFACPRPRNIFHLTLKRP